LSVIARGLSGLEAFLDVISHQCAVLEFRIRDRGCDGSRVRGSEINFTNNLLGVHPPVRNKDEPNSVVSTSFSFPELHKGNYVYLKYNQLNHPLCS
jgi:hypothetical protein